jgi:hypothetical protein
VAELGNPSVVKLNRLAQEQQPTPAGFGRIFRRAMGPACRSDGTGEITGVDDSGPGEARWRGFRA